MGPRGRGGLVWHLASCVKAGYTLEKYDPGHRRAFKGIINYLTNLRGEDANPTLSLLQTRENT